MKPHLTRSYALLVAVAAACHSLAPASVLAAAVAAQASGAIQFNVPQQSAATGILEFARQADIQILVSEKVLTGRQTSTVSGGFSVEEGLSRLLAGTGLAVASTDGKTVTLELREASGSQVLETINVFATLESQVGIGSKTGLSLRDTPKSVTMVTRERIEVQNLTSLKDILNQATGVTVSTYGPVDNFYYSRGFEVASIQIDGGTAAQLVRGTPDTAAYERVEVLRGVDGIFTGAGDPGGVINLVRKRGKATPEFTVNLSGARWDNLRAEVDLTGPLAAEGRLRGRVVGAYQEGNHFYDAGEVTREFFFGTAEYDLTPSTLLIAGASYENRQERGFPVGGLPRYSNGANLGLPRSTVLASDWNYWDFVTREYFARLEQHFGESGLIQLNYTLQNQDSPYGTFYPTGAVDPITHMGTILRANTTQTDYTDDRDLLDLSVSGEFSLFGRSHRYTVGADHVNSKRGYTQYRSLDENGNPYPARPIDVFNFDPYAYAPPTSRRLVATGPSKTEQTGVYLALNLQLTDPLRLTLGGRYTDFDYSSLYQPYAVNGAPLAGSLTKYDDSAFVPSAALTYELNQDWSAYASYGETFRAQANRLQAPLPGTPLAPMKGVSYELGVKGELFGQLNTALAVYRVERDGEGMQDLRYPVTPGDLGSSCCYLGDVAIEVNGFDAEVSGVVLSGWQMFAGYTYVDREVSGPTESLLAVTVTPKHQFKLWTTWQLPGALERLSISSGVTVQSSTSREGQIVDSSGNRVPATFVQGGYALLNASLQWRLSDTWSVGLHGDNLLDKTYYSAIGTIDNQNYYGMPRNFVLTLRGQW